MLKPFKPAVKAKKAKTVGSVKLPAFKPAAKPAKAQSKDYRYRRVTGTSLNLKLP